MGELGSTLRGKAITGVIDWGIAGIKKVKQQNEIKGLLGDQQLRAAMMGQNVLAEKFGNEIEAQELIANLALKKIKRNEAIALFLGKDANTTAFDIVKDFCDEIDRILSSDTDSHADVRALRIVEESSQDIRRIADELAANRQNETAQLALLAVVIHSVESEESDVEYLARLSHDIESSLASRYLNAYTSLCCGNLPDLEQLNDITGHNELILALAAVAISANELEFAEKVLSICSFNAEPIIAVIQALIDTPGQIYGQIELDRSVSSCVEPLINLINFEHLYKEGAFQAAAKYAEDAEIAWNPIAIEERCISELISAAVLDDDDLGAKIEDEIGRFKSWFPSDLAAQFKRALSLSFFRLNADKVRELIGKLPDDLSAFADDARKELELKECVDPRMARDILIWAEARNNPVLLTDAAIALIGLDADARSEILEIFERCSDWAIPNVGTLRYYAEIIDPDVSYEKYCKYGKGMGENPTFHLIAYAKFHDALPDIATRHIERAISIMKEPTAAKDLLSSSIWVPYLYEGGRSAEIRQIVEGVLPIAPYDHLISFFSALSGCNNAEGFIDDLVESMASSSFWDPRVAELVVRHLAMRGRIDVAGPVANAFFKTRPSELLAEIVIEWACESSVDPNEGVVAFLRQVDTSQSNLSLAGYYREKGDRSTSDALLVRAVFSDGEPSSRALVCYAFNHASDNDEAVERIDENCYAVLSSNDGEERTLLFLDNLSAVKEEGVSNSIGSLFTVQSKEFIGLKWLRLGDVCQINGVKLTVTEIGKVESLLCRAGFAELEEHPESAVKIFSIDELSDYVKTASEQAAAKDRMYKDGIKTDKGCIYLGIETGAIVAGEQRRLEFLGEVICNPNYPYRKNPISRNSQIDEDDNFIISYNAAVVLSFLDLPPEVLNEVRKKSFISKSTANKLKKDINSLLEEAFRSAGKLGYIGQGPVFFEYDDSTRQMLKDRWLPALSLISALETLEPVLDISKDCVPRLPFKNEAIDIETARKHNLVYVTEDYVESQICDAIGSVRRCGVTMMLACMGSFEYVFTEYAKKMIKWGAEPPIEEDLVAAYQYACISALSRLGATERSEELTSSDEGSLNDSGSLDC